MPEHETAFATTVHKAQGSEFDKVLLLLPAKPNRVVTRELLYTAATRSRAGVTIVGGAEVLEKAIVSPTRIGPHSWVASGRTAVLASAKLKVSFGRKYRLFSSARLEFPERLLLAELSQWQPQSTAIAANGCSSEGPRNRTRPIPGVR